MPDVIFHHPTMEPPRTLTVGTGANQITWSYGLNTRAIPTYGGEVVQILSAYVDDITIQGEVGTYNKMDQIYSFFLRYMVNASQPVFDQTPMTMQYPERGWELQIMPKSLPGVRYGTQVVAPTWQIQAQVFENDPNMAAVTLGSLVANGFDFGELHAGIGYDEENPFTDPAAAADQYDPDEFLMGQADFYNSLIDSYNSGDFANILQGFGGSSTGSTPAGSPTTPPANTPTHAPAKR